MKVDSKKKKKFSMKRIDTSNFHNDSTVSEGYSVSDVLSRLKGISASSQDSMRDRNSTSFGVEDDMGNMMRVTVRSSDASKFEQRLAMELAEFEKNNHNIGKVGGRSDKSSLAELLFDLKNEFEILDVEFPKIPSDIIYNASQANKAQSSSPPPSGEATPDGAVGEEVDEMEGMDDDMGGDDKIDLESDDFGDDGDDSEDLDDSEPDDEDDSDEMEDLEAMPSEDEASGERGMLKSILDMLKSMTDAKKAEAEAEIEKAKALQAQYSAQSARATIAQEEEFAKMEASAKKKKEEEKDARRLADLARYKASGVVERFNAKYQARLVEDEEFADERTLNRELMAARQKYAPLPGDDPETKEYKNKQFARIRREYMMKKQGAKLRAQHQERQAQRQQQDPARPGQQNQQQGPQQNRGPQQGVAPSRPVRMPGA